MRGAMLVVRESSPPRAKLESELTELPGDFENVREALKAGRDWYYQHCVSPLEPIVSYQFFITRETRRLGDRGPVERWEKVALFVPGEAIEPMPRLTLVRERR